VETKSNCKLISEEYIYCTTKLKILCYCGEIFETSFLEFKHNNKRQCNKCGWEITKNKEKLPYNKIKQIVEELGYILVSKEYIHSKMKIIIKDENEFYYTSLINDLKNKHIPHAFHTSNPYTIQNIKLWLQINNKDYELLSKEYKGNDKKLEWKCLKEDCQGIFKMSWNSILAGQNCACCAGMQVCLSNCLATKNPELIKEWHPILNKNLTPYNVTCGNDKKVWWKCSECGLEWNTIIVIRSKGSGCPRCNESKGEKRIDKYFINNNIFNTIHKDYLNLLGINNGSLSYDFYLPQFNLLIEYQGEQHEHYCKGFHKSKKDFEKQQEHDRRKRKYAKSHNIELLEIWYWDFDNIEIILKSTIEGRREE